MKKLTTNIVNYSMNTFLRYHKILFVLAIFTFMGMDGIAQPPPPGGTGGPPCWPPPCIPIDGGISWLLAAGVAYGAKKSLNLKKKEED